MKEKDYFIKAFEHWDYGYHSLDVFKVSDGTYNVHLETKGFRLNCVPHLAGFDIDDIYICPKYSPSQCGYMFVSLHYVKV